MAKIKNKKAETSSKLKTLAFSKCTVVLNNIALDKELVQRYKLQFPEKKTRKLKSSLSSNNICNTSKIWMLKKSEPKGNSVRKTSYITRNQSRSLPAKNNKKCQKLQYLDNALFKSDDKGITSGQKQCSRYNSSAKTFSSTNNDEISSNFSNTCFSSISEEIISIHNKKSNRKVQRKKGSKRRLSFNLETSVESFIHNNENDLDNKKVSINGNKRKKYKENCLVEVPQTKQATACLGIENNHLHADSNSNGIVNKTEIEQCQLNISKDNSKNFFNSHNNIKDNNLNKNKIETSQSDTSLTTCSTIQTMDYSESLLKSISPTVSKTNHVTQIIPNVLVHNEKQCTNNKKNKKSLPKITEDLHILPKDAIKITKRITNDENMQISEFTPTLNNNIELENKNVDNDKLHTVKVDHKKDSLLEVRNNSSNVNVNNINGEISKVCKDSILNEQKQLNKLDNDKMPKSNMLQDDICNKNSDKTENTSNLVDIRENCNVNKPLPVNQEIVKQDRKCTAEKNTTATTFMNKKTKLNRDIWLQNNVPETGSLCDQKCNKISDISSKTIESTTVEKLNSTNQKRDLRYCLNEKKNEKFVIPLTSENEFNNKNNAELKQIISCNESSDEESVSNNTSLNGEKDNQSEEKDSDDDDCISLFAESFDSDFFKEDTSFNEQNRSTNLCSTNAKNAQITKLEVVKPQMDELQISEKKVSKFEINKCQIKKHQTVESEVNNPQTSNSQSDRTLYPYKSCMSGFTFDKYVKQNVTEFNNEYAKYIDNNIQNKPDETKECNNKVKQIICTSTSYIPKAATVLNLTSYFPKKLFYGYCFQYLRRGDCNNPECIFKEDLRNLINVICWENSETIFHIMQYLLDERYIFLFKKIYAKSIEKLSEDKIFKIYKKFHETKIVSFYDKKQIVPITMEQLLNMEMPLETIVNYLVECIISNIDVNNYYMNILNCVNSYVKEGEYWKTIRTSILRLPPNKCIIEKILTDCIENKNFTDLEDVNNNLLNKVSLEFMSTLNTDLLNYFKSLLPDKTANNSYFALEQNVGGSSYATIASPDGSANLSQTEFPKINNDITNTSANENDCATETNGEVYRVHLIEDLSEPRSVYRDHEKFWKFYADLDRFKQGLLHEDYNYVIDILKFYSEKQDESSLFIHACCTILQREITRSGKHLANIVSRSVQMDTFTILGKMLFDIAVDILTNLINMESWGLALQLIQSLATYNLPYNAEYFLLSAEIYLANKQALEAYELLKHKNIICTSSEKWNVESTSEDERVRNKVMQILMDSLCNDYIEYALFLFEFLLKDQSSQHYPIDLSSYANRLIILFLLKEDSNSILQMANLVLKYTFALSKTTGRALTSTLIHLDKNLAIQMYNYAESIGIYSAMKLWPITCIIINNDLTEEEIYLIFLQLLKNLISNFGHTIEFASPYQIKIYVVLEIISTTHFYCAELQNRNKKAIDSIKKLVQQVLQKRFDPPIMLMRGSKGRTYKLQSKSIINYLKTEHCH